MRQDATTPADGSVFGWLHDGDITALIIYYGAGGWSLCPRTDMPEDRWPPYADDAQLAALVRDRLQAGGVIDIGPLAGDSRGLVFWVPVAEEAGGGVIAVRADLPPGPGPFVLRRGRYAHFSALRAGIPLPSLDVLLADERRVDLGPRFPLAA